MPTQQAESTQFPDAIHTFARYCEAFRPLCGIQELANGAE